MPAFLATPQQAQLTALYPGDTFALVNDASTDSGITSTIQVAIGPDPGGNYRITLTNTSGQTATVQTAPKSATAISPADGAFEPYSDEGTAITVANGTSKSFNCTGPWLRCTFSPAPTTGSLILSR